MKELTIEEKAARYDLAIEVAKKYHNGILEDVMEIIFPELKESEDEKIRKEIINYFKCQSRDEPSRKDTHNRWIAWLEKQDEKPQGKTALEATKEEKVDNANKVEQKPAWSEEDERNLNDAILFIETGTYSLDKDNLINWLKSFKPHNAWKPSEEQKNALYHIVRDFGKDKSEDEMLLESLLSDLDRL